MLSIRTIVDYCDDRHLKRSLGGANQLLCYVYLQYYYRYLTLCLCHSTIYSVIVLNNYLLVLGRFWRQCNKVTVTISGRDYTRQVALQTVNCTFLPCTFCSLFIFIIVFFLCKGVLTYIIKYDSSVIMDIVARTLTIILLYKSNCQHHCLPLPARLSRATIVSINVLSLALNFERVLGPQARISEESSLAPR
jgi:hypothetical protein